MIGFLLKKIFGTRNEREIKRVSLIVDRINAQEASIEALSDADLRAKTDEFKGRLEQGQNLDDLLPEAFAVVREASKRTLGMRHFDVQLIGGIILHEGRIAEMKTGEGKTLVATLPVYLNALTGRGVHVVTVNDYLARRDAQWMSPVYTFLGLSVGVIVHGLNDEQRQQAYNSDITYGTNNEFGFDYLRDNMKFDLSEYAQRELNFAIVDEVDSILVDEARTPLIISGPAEESTDKYYKINRIIPSLKMDVDYTIEEKTKTAALTEEGNIKVEKLLNAGNLYDPENVDLVHHVHQALKAHTLFQSDVDYVVKDGQVMIVDEFTGRLMPGRRWSDGLHQAIEAKEGVKIENENQTLASITFQNYFRLYNKLAGMTGTAETEAPEFGKIYNLDVVVIPTHRPMIRQDNADYIYKSEQGKFSAAVEEIAELHKKGQPVLVGTISIAKSEALAALLRKKGVRHSVLNAKYHEMEAEIVAQAGRYGAVTIATNMAGRGTDIVLGGNPEGLARQELKGKEYSKEEWEKTVARFKVLCASEKEKVIAAGGLHILGTERHEARRIDNQLRGRSGRQGDPGSSRFYLSLGDDLLRIFGSGRISGLMDKLGMEEDVPIEHRMVSRSIENAQKKVEEHNFDIRKHILEYDDVMNQQRKVIYEQRRQILAGEDLKDEVLGLAEELLDGIIGFYCPEDAHSEDWDMAGMRDALAAKLSYRLDGIDPQKLSRDELSEKLRTAVIGSYEAKEQEVGAELMRRLEKVFMLQAVDYQWKDHLLAMDHLKEGIGLRGYGQKDPLVEYKREGFDMFEEMKLRIVETTVENLFRVKIAEEGQDREIERRQRRQQATLNFVGAGAAKPAEPVHVGAKVGRNDLCPCGSGKKYKKCHGK
ncbi:MAG: preprotein translocase subunit SecA [Nitrospirae bacterium GWC2_57_13]|nr:MAG: preprotein translocase subunit SecA [Nitrospirae bacterium GWC2_57_13]